MTCMRSGQCGVRLVHECNCFMIIMMCLNSIGSRAGVMSAPRLGLKPRAWLTANSPQWAYGLGRPVRWVYSCAVLRSATFKRLKLYNY